MLLSEIQRIQFSGVHAVDSQNMRKVYAFVADEANTVHDRAEALRHIAVKAMGLTGDDAGVGVSDEEFLNAYLRCL